MKYQLVLYTIYNTTTLFSLYHQPPPTCILLFSIQLSPSPPQQQHTSILTIPTMPPRKKRKGTKSNTSNADEEPVFEEVLAVGANAVAAAVTQLSQDDGAAVDETPLRRSPRRSKTSTTTSSLSNDGDGGGAEGQEEKLTTESTVETALSCLFLGNNSFAEVYANDPSEAYAQLYLLLYPRLSRFQLSTTQYASTGLYQTDFPLEIDAECGILKFVICSYSIQPVQ